MTVTIDKFGRVLIPKPLRDRLGLAPGTALDLKVRDTDDGILTLELRPDCENAGLVREGALLVHHGRFTDPDFDPVQFLRDQRSARARELAGPGGRADTGSDTRA